MSRIAIYPGSFDPITNGHIDIITRASKMFDELILLVCFNPLKRGGSFTPEERIDLIHRCVDLPNVRVDRCDGLVADYASQVGACALVKGLRAVSDFEDEFQQALINKHLAPDVETLFMVANSEYMYLSSSAVRQVSFFGGDVSTFVPESILSLVEKKLKRIIESQT